MDADRCWLSQPSEWQPLFRDWHEENADRTWLHEWPQWGGERVLALTIAPPVAVRGDTARSHGPGLAPIRLLVAIPHAHEPAVTAAAVDAASQWLTGRHLDGTAGPVVPSPRMLLTLIPDANPQGRARSPRRCWDGTFCDNEAFWKYAFGVAADGSRFPRVPEWSAAERQPETIGLVWEQVGPDLWVEPNTSRRSTYSRAMDQLFAQYRYTHMLEMHQHEWNEAALLPDDFDDAPAPVQQAASAWAHALIEAWRQAGADPRPEPSVPYRGGPRQRLFHAFWGDRFPGMLRLASEVRNNRLEPGGTEPTPKERQLRMAAAVVEATLRHVATTGTAPADRPAE